MQGHHEKVEGHSKKISGAGNCSPSTFFASGATNTVERGTFLDILDTGKQTHDKTDCLFLNYELYN